MVLTARMEEADIVVGLDAGALRGLLGQQVARARALSLDRELDTLPEKYRRPLILFHLEGKSLAETAATLGSAEGTVGAWLSRGRVPKYAAASSGDIFVAMPLMLI